MNRYDYHPKRYTTEVSVFGLLLGLYMAAVFGGLLAWAAWDHRSIELAMGTASILGIALFVAAPLRFFRTGWFRLLGVFCGLLLCAAGIIGIVLCIQLWVNPLDDISGMAEVVAFFGVAPAISAAVILFAKAYYGPSRRPRCGNLACPRRGQYG